MHKLALFLKDTSGATAIEYGLIAAGIAVAIIVAVQTTGTNLRGRSIASLMHCSSFSRLPTVSVSEERGRPSGRPLPFVLRADRYACFC